MGLIHWIVLGLIGLFVLVRVVAKLAPMPIPFFGWWILTNPLRQFVMPSSMQVRRLRLKPRDRALEVGSGPGYLTPEAAQVVGEDGLIVALDLQMPLLCRLKRRLAQDAVQNVVLVRADACKLPFKPEVFDAAFIVGVLGELPDKPAALAALHHTLRAGGLLAIAELLPDPHYTLPSTVARLCEDAGLLPDDRSGSFLWHTTRWRKPGDNA